MTGLTPEVFPNQVMAMAGNIGGPPDDVDAYSYQTPFALQVRGDTYRGPRIGDRVPATQPKTIRSLSREWGFGIIDSLLERLGVN